MYEHRMLSTYRFPSTAVCSATSAFHQQHRGDGVTVVACSNPIYEHLMLATCRFPSASAVSSTTSAFHPQHRGGGLTVAACNNRVYENNIYASDIFLPISSRSLFSNSTISSATVPTIELFR